MSFESTSNVTTSSSSDTFVYQTISDFKLKDSRFESILETFFILIKREELVSDDLQLMILRRGIRSCHESCLQNFFNNIALGSSEEFVELLSRGCESSQDYECLEMLAFYLQTQEGFSEVKECLDMFLERFYDEGFHRLKQASYHNYFEDVEERELYLSYLFGVDSDSVKKILLFEMKKKVILLEYQLKYLDWNPDSFIKELGDWYTGIMEIKQPLSHVHRSHGHLRQSSLYTNVHLEGCSYYGTYAQRISECAQNHLSWCFFYPPPRDQGPLAVVRFYPRMRVQTSDHYFEEVSLTGLIRDGSNALNPFFHHPEGRSLSLLHWCLKGLLFEFQNLQPVKEGREDELSNCLKCIAQIYWIFCHASPYDDGAHIIGKVLVRALLYSKSIEAGPWNQGVNPYAAALIQPIKEEFIVEFPTLFTHLYVTKGKETSLS